VVEIPRKRYLNSNDVCPLWLMVLYQPRTKTVLPTVDVRLCKVTTLANLMGGDRRELATSLILDRPLVGFVDTGKLLANEYV